MRGMVILTFFLFWHAVLPAQIDSTSVPPTEDSAKLLAKNDTENHLAVEKTTPQSRAELGFKRHDPKRDANLNPYFNRNINPDSNLSINPSMNYNINPIREKSLDPAQNSSINPMINLQLNPQSNDVLNPVVMKSLRPSSENWSGMFIFSDSNQLFGYISPASQYVMLSFDINGTWNGYFVKAGRMIYNYFTLFGVWTGMFLAYDNQSGYNLFDKNGKWTHIHVK